MMEEKGCGAITGKGASASPVSMLKNKKKRPKEEQKREQVMQFYSPEKTSATTYNY